MRRRVDGALVVGVSPEHDDLAGLAAMDVPVVLLGARAAGLPSVSIDDRLGARTAVEHLVSAGHSGIALISGRRLPTPILPENDRLAGYLDALAAHGLPAPEDFREIGEFTIDGGERAMTALLARSPRPTAVFCMSDEMAYGALQALRRAGIRAGGDRQRGEVAVVGFDGHDLAAIFELSTVAQPVRALGRAAAQLLMSVVNSSPAPGAPVAPADEVTLATALVVRASSRQAAEKRQVTEP
jgi:DNA-binding LacI/PurR family transcriptional regulator